MSEPERLSPTELDAIHGTILSKRMDTSWAEDDIEELQAHIVAAEQRIVDYREQIESRRRVIDAIRRARIEELQGEVERLKAAERMSPNGQ